MPDREKVMTWLEICGTNRDCSGCCPYSENGWGEYGQCRESLMADAYNLLKEQEAKTVESIQMDRSDKWGADLTGYCPSCKRPLKSRFNKRFCGECGQAVKWE